MITPKNSRTLVFWLASFSLLLGCAVPAREKAKERLLPEIDVMRMKEDSETAIQLTRQIKADLEQIRLRLNRLELNQAELDQLVRNLPLARLEEFENRLVLMNEETLELRKMIDGRAGVKLFHTGKKPQAAPEPDQQPMPFKRAMIEFNRQNFELSIDLFGKFVKEDKESNYRDDAWFWIGESYFEMGDYAKAIDFYQRVFTYPQSDKEDDAQYKMAMAYLRSGDRRQAVAEFKKLTVIFPDSEYISRAKVELQKLNVDP